VFFFRPWYVLEPGRWWPLLLKPLYRNSRLVPALKEKAEKLTPVPMRQMISALLYAVEYPSACGCEVYEVSDIQLIKFRCPVTDKAL